MTRRIVAPDQMLDAATEWEASAPDAAAHAFQFRSRVYHSHAWDAGDGLGGDVFYVPEYYEPKYAYPLIVWLHASGRDAAEMLPWLSAISERNHLGVAPRGPWPDRRGVPGCYRWPTDAATTLPLVEESVRQLRRNYHVHTERIYLAGCADGGQLALSLLLAQPQWFAGAMAIDSPLPAAQGLLRSYRRLQGKRVFLATGMSAPSLPAHTPASLAVLDTAGVAVTTLSAADSADPRQTIARAIDRWIIDGIHRAC